jgi:hypothetical protein
VRTRSFVIGAVIVVALAVLLGVAASARHREPRRIAIFGDSLANESGKYWRAMMNETPGFDATHHSLPGTAICDWFDQMDKVAADVDPQIVAFQFVGNDILPCMRNPDGSQLSKAEYLRRWRRYTQEAIEKFDSDTTIYLVGAPEMGDHDNRVYEIFQDLADDYPNTHFVDGGRLVSPHRTFVETLPCLPGEPCRGPVVDGVPNIRVRNIDQIHFCPDPDSYGKQCPVYSSGAYRFAITLFEATTGEPAPEIAL